MVGIGSLRIVFEISETHVGEPPGTDGFGDTGGQAVVVNDGAAVQTARAKAISAKFAESALTGQREVVQAEAPEDLVIARSAVIDANVKRFLVERTCTLGDEVILKEIGRCRIGDTGSLKFCQHIAHILIYPANRNPIRLSCASSRSAKLRATRAVEGVSCSGVENQAATR